MTGSKKAGVDYTCGQVLEEQIPQVIKMYGENGDTTNQAFMAVGSKESIRLKDPQYLKAVDTRIQNGNPRFMVYFRSWNLWAGLPSNLAAIQILKEYMAREIGV